MNDINISNNKRIAKNTFFLYFRMGIVMLVTLYTSRVTLEILGITEYGIWSLVFTVITSVSFITIPLTTATQRFLNVELAKKDTEMVREVFKTSVFLYCLFAAIVFLIFESLGLWFLNYRLEIPRLYLNQANYVYQFAVLSFIISLLRLPFDATLIANEKFNFIAVIGIIEVICKLAAVYMLLTLPSIPHLTLLAFLSLFISVVIAVSYVIYTKKHYYSFLSYGLPNNRTLLKSMLSFSGWNIFGSFAVMTSNQGIGVLINFFFGVIVNASIGISNQIQNALNQLIGSFQSAFQPQIVKRYAVNNSEDLIALIETTSRISFILMFVVGCPIIFNIDLILSLWLKDVPPLTDTFSIYVILIMWVEAIGGPLWMAIHATGEIKRYQITISSTLLLTILLSYIFLKLNYPAQIVFQIRLAIAIVALGVKVFFVVIKDIVSFRSLLSRTIFPSILICVLGSGLLFILKNLFDFSAFGFPIYGTIIFLLLMAPIIYIFGLSKSQRHAVVSFLKSRL